MFNLIHMFMGVREFCIGIRSFKLFIIEALESRKNPHSAKLSNYSDPFTVFASVKPVS